MRKALGQRGWKEDPSLPDNWIYRKRQRILEFCDSFGNHFKSKDKAIKNAVESNSLDEENILKIKNFIKTS